eukprot:TRINITY_DN8344_c0_g1_i2.p1 TRINITY_DN8344_c0_g1~~TRINITY_DN8344_c0_g1_i2.p1  ORF type:complete len:757 (+),score=159.09 TRINITY_DN8344_c0_g1_i2:81-2273(+)
MLGPLRDSLRRRPAAAAAAAPAGGLQTPPREGPGPPSPPPPSSLSVSGSSSTTAAAPAGSRPSRSPAPAAPPPPLPPAGGSSQQRPPPASPHAGFRPSAELRTATPASPARTPGPAAGGPGWSPRVGSSRGGSERSSEFQSSAAGAMLALHATEVLRRRRTPGLPRLQRRGSTTRGGVSLRLDIWPLLMQTVWGLVTAVQIASGRRTRPLSDPASLLKVRSSGRGRVATWPPPGAADGTGVGAVGVLHLQIAEGRGLRPAASQQYTPSGVLKRSSGRSAPDAWVAVTLGDCEVHSSCGGSTRNPQWDARFDLPISDPTANLVLSVHDDFGVPVSAGGGDLIGRAVLPLPQLCPRVRCGKGEEETWLELLPNGPQNLDDGQFVLGNAFAAKGCVPGAMFRPSKPLGALRIVVSVTPLTALVPSYVQGTLQQPRRVDFDLNILFRDADRLRRLVGMPALLCVLRARRRRWRVPCCALWSALCHSVPLWGAPFATLGLLTLNSVCARTEELRVRRLPPRQGGSWVFDDDNPEVSKTPAEAINQLYEEYKGQGVLAVLQNVFHVVATAVSRAQHALSFGDPPQSLGLCLFLLALCCPVALLLPTLYQIGLRWYLCVGGVLLLQPWAPRQRSLGSFSPPGSVCPSPTGRPAGATTATPPRAAAAAGVDGEDMSPPAETGRRAAVKRLAVAVQEGLYRAAMRFPSDLDRDHRWVCAQQRMQHAPLQGMPTQLWPGN